MNMENNKLPLLIILGLGIVATLIVAVYCFIGIWTKSYDNNNIEDDEKKLEEIGSYTRIYNIDLASQVSEYTEDIFFRIAMSDVDWLFDKLNEEYIAYKNFNRDTFKAYLEKEGILGKNFKTAEYTSTTKNNDRVIIVDMATEDNTSRDRIVIIEYSPNNYKIAFDDFISSINTPIKFKISGLDITVSEQQVFTQSIKIQLSIANNTDSNFTLNSNKEYEMIVLEFSDNTETLPIVGTSIGREIELNSGKTLNYNMEFSITDINNINYSKIRIKDVKNLSNNSVDDLEINF